MSYFPQRESLDPSGIADALSESLTNQYGNWRTYDAQGLEQLFLAVDRVESRNYAVCLENSGLLQQGSSYFWFDFAQPVDMSRMERYEFDIAAMAKNGSELTGNGTATLTDVNGRKANIDFGFSLDSNYNRRTFTIANFTAETGFDWTKVAQWLFYVYHGPYTNWAGFKIWIDAGPFIKLQVANPTIRVMALDAYGNSITGKSMQLTNPTGFSQTYPLPFGPVGVNPGSWSIKILDADFTRWQDGSTENPKTLTTEYDKNYAFSAIFGVVNGGNNNLLYLACGVGAIALFAYLLIKR